MSVVVVVVVLLSSGICVFGTKYERCFSPIGSQGVCQNLIGCKPLLELLLRGNSRPGPRVIDFLLRSQCGFDGIHPIVCCPFSTRLKDIYGHLGMKTEEEPVVRNLNIPCGLIYKQDKVLGGNATTLGEFPWMALIGYKTKRGVQHRCGASLISRRYVLTAAHCVTALRDMVPITVRLGEHDLSTVQDCQDGKGCSPPVKNIEIEEIIPHPGFYKPELRNDIALVRLSQRVNFNDWVRPVCLPQVSRKEEEEFEKAIAAGWGMTEAGIRSQVLQKVSLPIISNSDCFQIYKKKATIIESQMCAGGEPGKDSCSGDSGGPLQVIGVSLSGELVYYQVGVVSFGPTRCGTSGYPGVYTRVSHYIDWITKTAQE